MAMRSLLIALLLVTPSLHADVEPVTDVTCDATDGNNYPVTVSWINDDPDGEYSEFEIVRDGEVIASVIGGDTESYTDSSRGPGGQMTYTVNVYSASADCWVESLDSCRVSIGASGQCASDDDFVPIEFEAGDTNSDTVDWENEDLAAIDGTSDEDLSPTEDDRVDITDLVLALSFSADSVEDLLWELSSPEGTSLTLWDSSGGDVEWESSTVYFSDVGEEIPDDAPAACEGQSCIYLPAGTGSFADFYGEDAQGEWTLEGTADGTATLEDWCVLVYTDEFTEGPHCWLRGDVNGDSVVQPLVDALFLLLHYFGDGTNPAPPCFQAADVDGNGLVSAIIDALRLLQHYFGNADEPPAPFPECGRADPSYEYTGAEEPCEEDGYCC